MSETLQVIRERRSCKSYKPDMIPEEVIQTIAEAGTWAPSGMGRQSAIIVAITNKELRDRLSRMNAQIMGADMDPFYGAPVVLVVLADKKVAFSGHIFECVDSGFGTKEPVDVVVRPEDVDIVPEDKGMLKGVVTSVTFLGVHYEIIVDINGFKWMIQTTDFVDVDEHIGLFIEPDAIHIMKKSEYSGMFGDYSSFSNELDELSDTESENAE